MRKAVMVAVIFAAASLQGASAADRHCYSPAELEAEQAIRFQTNLMVISSACKDTVYGEFRAHNTAAIIHYQKIMITHFRSQVAFDAWNTSLANEISLQQGVQSTAAICQKAVDLERMASTLDSKGLHDYAVAQAASPAATHPRCGR